MPLNGCYQLVLSCLSGTRPEHPFLDTDGPARAKDISTRLKADFSSGFGKLGLLDVVPLLWAYLPRGERLVLRRSCRDGRRIHDALVSNLCVCESPYVLSSLPAARVATCAVPVCHDTASDMSKTLRGFISRGCRPQSLLLFLNSANERKRLEQSLAALLPLAAAPLELASLHLAGVPLTQQTARALQPLLVAMATAAAIAPSSAAAAAVMAAGGAALGSPSAELATMSAPPPPPPLRLFLYGYDLTRSPAPAVLESLAATAALRLQRLELWGCVGWPPRLAASLRACSRLERLSLALQPLAAPPATAAATAGAAAAASQPQHTASGVAGGALATYSHLAAALTAAAAIRSLGTLRQLRSLELRGVAFRASAAASAAKSHARPARRRGGPKPEASPEDAAEAAGLTPQSLACALFQLTALTSLCVEGLRNPTPLVSALGAMHGLVRLELPDTFGPPAELAALARAAPRLAELTLGSVGHGPVLILTDTAERAASAARRTPEPLPLPPALTALRVARFRPTLRAMRALRRALEEREAAAVVAAAAADRASGGGGAERRVGGGGSAGRLGGRGSGDGGRGMSVVVPGIELDLPDVDFDPLQAFHRTEDGVMRSVLLPESAEALAAAIALLAPRHDVASAAAPLGHDGALLDVGSTAGDPWVDGQAPQQRELVIHNDYGSLAAAAPEAEEAEELELEGRASQPPVVPSRRSPQWPGAIPRSVTVPSAVSNCGRPASLSRGELKRLCATGHAVWIRALALLRLTALELYGIGLTRADLAAVAELTTLRRLTLAAGELNAEALPCLAALPALEELELIRCSPRRRTPHIGRFSFSAASAGPGCSTPHSRGSYSFAAAGDADGEGELYVDVGQRALLELCVSAPRLRRLHVVRCAGTGAGAGGVDGPLGAEWVRRQLAAMGTRQRGAAGGGGGGDGKGSEAVQGTCWPEVVWN